MVLILISQVPWEGGHTFACLLATCPLEPAGLGSTSQSPRWHLLKKRIGGGEGNSQPDASLCLDRPCCFFLDLEVKSLYSLPLSPSWATSVLLGPEAVSNNYLSLLETLKSSGQENPTRKDSS